MKKIAIGITATIFLLTACSPNTGSKQTQTETQNETVIKFWRAGTDEATKLFYQKMIKEYQTKNPNIKVEYAEYDFGDMDTKLNLGYASGTAPDVLRFTIASVAQRASLKQYMPLDSYIDGWEDKDDILPSAYEVGLYGNKRYGIGVDISPNFLVYRKDLFAEAGLDPNVPPQTWEELKTYAAKLTKREGDKVVLGGMQLPTTGRGHHHMIMTARQNGALLVDEDKNIPIFDEKPTVEALDFLASFQRDKLLVPYNMGKDESPFKKGTAAMGYVNGTSYADILKAHPDWKEKVGVAEPVDRSSKSTFAGAQIYFISQDSKIKDASWEFIKFLASKEKTWALYKEVGVAINRKSLKDEFEKDNPLVNNILYKTMEYGKGNPKVQWAPLLVKHIDIAYEEAMYGKKTAEQALKDAVSNLNSEIKK